MHWVVGTCLITSLLGLGMGHDPLFEGRKNLLVFSNYALLKYQIYLRWFSYTVWNRHIERVYKMNVELVSSFMRTSHSWEVHIDISCFGILVNLSNSLSFEALKEISKVWRKKVDTYFYFHSVLISLLSLRSLVMFLLSININLF